jgi:ABC-type lipoprotein export system ATPase subunit
MTEFLRAHRLFKTYSKDKKKIVVLKNISLSVQKGEFVAVVGPSGAGKTTMLNLLSGLDRPDSGEVFYEGRHLWGLKTKERLRIMNRELGFVFQFYHLIPDCTALENVMLPSRIQPYLKQNEMIERSMTLLEQMGLRERCDHFPSELSGGEQQRVAIARALMNNPSVIFCDEPTGNLDAENRERVSDVLRRLSQEEDKTVLIVTHDDKIASLADRVERIKDGQFLTEE